MKPLNQQGGVAEACRTHLWEFVPHFLYLLPFLADDGSVKTLFDDQVLCTLVLLRRGEEEESEDDGRGLVSMLNDSPAFSTNHA